MGGNSRNSWGTQVDLKLYIYISNDRNVQCQHTVSTDSLNEEPGGVTVPLVPTLELPHTLPDLQQGHYHQPKHRTDEL